MKKITIIGSGFGGLTAAKTLRKIDKYVEITLIAPKAEFFYWPSLIWVPSNKVDESQLRIPLDNFFSRKNIQFIEGEVTGLYDEGRSVLVGEKIIKNDALIIASGGRFIKKLPGIENSITPCEGLPGLVKVRDQLKQMKGGKIAIGFSGNPNEPSAMRGGPMFEFLFGLDTQLRKEKRRDKFEITFFTPAKQPGARLGEKAVQGILKEMTSRGIHTHLGYKIKNFETNKVITEGGSIDADMILFMPGMTGNEWFDNTDLPRSPGGLLRANKFCQVEDSNNVFVVGDSGSFPGPEWMPKQAHMADLQAEAAAKNAIDSLNGIKPSHSFKVELMCIVDSNNQGIYISRNMTGSTIFPKTRLMHWAKRFFGWWYCRQYR